MNDSYSLLIAAACEAREQSYAPYSRFRVGAALLGTSGRVYTGCNVENASLGLSICAERVAACRAVADGERTFEALAICTDSAQPTPPCGACRQFLREFGPELIVLLAGAVADADRIERHRLADLLAVPFTTFRRPEKDEADE
jgi:cytidine deaminase